MAAAGCMSNNSRSRTVSLTPITASLASRNIPGGNRRGQHVRGKLHRLGELLSYRELERQFPGMFELYLVDENLEAAKTSVVVSGGSDSGTTTVEHVMKLLGPNNTHMDFNISTRCGTRVKELATELKILTVIPPSFLFSTQPTFLVDAVGVVHTFEVFDRAALA